MIVLVGFMGAGKTTVGTLLAARLGLPFVDSDQVIEQRAARPVRQIFAQDGEPAFRALEHQVIAELLDGPPIVLALGGGAPEHPATQALLGRGDDRALTQGDSIPPDPPGRPPREGMARGDDPAGLAARGGGPRPPREGMADAQVVYLHVSYEQALQRVGGDRDRPLLARPDLARLYGRRLGVYPGVAMLTVPTDGRDPLAITEDILLATTLLRTGKG